MICKLTSCKLLRKINIANEDLYVRTGTADLAVAASSLIVQEYSNIQVSDPLVIVDAGAYIGTSAIFFATRYPNAKVFAIEPEHDNYEILSKNVIKYDNIIPIKAALWGQKDTRTIQNRFTGPWGYTVSVTSNKLESTDQQVDCITIGMLLEEYGLVCIDILKMDIEGGEKNVFQASDDWIDKVKVITAELHDRICVGCERAFYFATREFARFEKSGEKITAYRK